MWRMMLKCWPDCRTRDAARCITSLNGNLVNIGGDWRIAMPTKSKIDFRERKLRAEAVQYGFASVRMEGLEPGPEAETVANRFIEGELTHEEYHSEMRRLALDMARHKD